MLWRLIEEVPSWHCPWKYLSSCEGHGIGNHLHINCLFNTLFGLSKTASKLVHYWTFMRTISQRPVNSPHKGPVMWEAFPHHDIIIDHIPGGWFKERHHLTSIWNPIVEIRRSDDRLISTMGFPILVRWHLYIESGLLSLAVIPQHDWRLHCPLGIHLLFISGGVSRYYGCVGPGEVSIITWRLSHIENFIRCISFRSSW